MDQFNGADRVDFGQYRDRGASRPTTRWRDTGVAAVSRIPPVQGRDCAWRTLVPLRASRLDKATSSPIFPSHSPLAAPSWRRGLTRHAVGNSVTICVPHLGSGEAQMRQSGRRVVLVTGGATGIGLAIVRRFLAE